MDFRIFLNGDEQEEDGASVATPVRLLPPSYFGRPSLSTQLTANLQVVAGIIFASHYSALRSRSGVAPEGKGTGAWHSGKKRLSCTTA